MDWYAYVPNIKGHFEHEDRYFPALHFSWQGWCVAVCWVPTSRTAHAELLTRCRVARNAEEEFMLLAERIPLELLETWGPELVDSVRKLGLNTCGLCWPRPVCAAMC